LFAAGACHGFGKFLLAGCNTLDAALGGVENLSAG